MKLFLSFFLPEFICIIITCIPTRITAKDARDTGYLYSYADRLTAFGKTIPQEKVYVHMDNTCYFLGDTIWFAAYTRQTNTGQPSNTSRILYVELLNNDGYLVERKLVEMKGGKGNGRFVLRGNPTMFAGFYELRAYTRWQLNWGEYEHPHMKIVNQWFFNKTCSQEYFRDYEKLYSRVFPVYDKPQRPGEYADNMTLRPLVKYRDSSIDEPAQPVLTLFPEGGQLVAGKECRVAFEAAMSDGKCLSGTLKVAGQSVRTINRGRGVFTITPQWGKSYSCTFTSDDGLTVRQKLKAKETSGVAMKVTRAENLWCVKLDISDNLASNSIGISVMHEGRLAAFHPLDELPKGELILQESALQAGVHQVTVFDEGGRVYADRLFFVMKDETRKAPITLKCGKTEYKPNEKIELGIASTSGKGDSGVSISLSVFDSASQRKNFDNGNILTEMLLSSEIRGFVPNPGWYFEKDDEEHRQALDLLMMTQGWRRYNWREMAVKGEGEIVHPAEQSQLMTGAVHTYKSSLVPNTSEYTDNFYSRMGYEDDRVSYNSNNNRGYTRPYTKGYWGKHLKSSKRADELGIKNKNLRKRMMEDGEQLEREVRVHGEFVLPIKGNTVEDAMQGDATTKDGQFRIMAPRYQGNNCLFFLSASDTTKWKEGEEHSWIEQTDKKLPEYYVRLSFPYPRFVKPYDFYMTHLLPDDEKEENAATDLEYRQQTMRQLTVYDKKGIRRNDIDVPPALRIDAYEAYNHAIDAGLIDGWIPNADDLGTSVAHSYIADMGVNETPACNVFCGIPSADPELSMKMEHKVFSLANLDSVYIFTDYAPRKEGSEGYLRSGLPNMSVSLRCYPDPSKRRGVFRDRFLRLPGFASPFEFYSPDYSKQRLPEGQKDYRRTLYWNPNLELDENGEAHVTFYNNSRTTQISVEAEGQASDGTLLWNK